MIAYINEFQNRNSLIKTNEFDQSQPGRGIKFPADFHSLG